MKNNHEERLNQIKKLYVYNENKVEGVIEEGQQKGLEVLFIPQIVTEISTMC